MLRPTSLVSFPGSHPASDDESLGTRPGPTYHAVCSVLQPACHPQRDVHHPVRRTETLLGPYPTWGLSWKQRSGVSRRRSHTRNIGSSGLRTSPALDGRTHPHLVFTGNSACDRKRCGFDYRSPILFLTFRLTIGTSFSSYLIAISLFIYGACTYTYPPAVTHFLQTPRTV